MPDLRQAMLDAGHVDMIGQAHCGVKDEDATQLPQQGVVAAAIFRRAARPDAGGRARGRHPQTRTGGKD